MQRILGGAAMLLLIGGYAAFEASVVARSQHLFEPLHSFDQFVSADRAAARCGSDDGERRRFRANLEAVRRRASEDLAETHPKEAPAVIEQRLAERTHRLEAEVDALVDASGCEGPELWELLKLHQQRARLRVR